jgi:hypothetical protein
LSALCRSKYPVEGWGSERKWVSRSVLQKCIAAYGLIESTWILQPVEPQLIDILLGEDMHKYTVVQVQCLFQGNLEIL